LLFLKPLGTFSNILQARNFVNVFVLFPGRFPQDLFCLFGAVCAVPTVHLLWKNHRSVILF